MSTPVLCQLRTRITTPDGKQHVKEHDGLHSIDAILGSIRYVLENMHDVSGVCLETCIAISGGPYAEKGLTK